MFSAMSFHHLAKCAVYAVLGICFLIPSIVCEAQESPNILFIMADDVGWSNPSCYHQGLMSSRTPNIDRIAREGMRFTDHDV